MFKRILVPTDFTPKGETALKAAVQIARKTGSIIDLVHIVESPLILKGKHGEDAAMSSLAQNLINISNTNLQHFKDKYADTEVIINIRTKVDELPEKVAELLTNEDYDLIVVGGSTVYQFYEFIGKTHPERIVELAKCPVLVLNKEIETFKVEKLVLPSSLDSSINKVIEQIKDLVTFFDANLEVLYVNTPAQFKTTDEIEKAWKEFRKVHELNDITLSVYNDNSVKKGIIRYARKRDIDLILLTSKHSSKPLSLIRGDITEHIVNHEDFPVLTFNLKTVI